MKLNAMWWWIDRWRKSTAYTDMTLEEQGAYRNLLDEAQLRGGAIPNNEHILAKACGDATRWKRVRGEVLARFTLTESGWRNETLDEVMHESQRRANKQRRYRNKAGNVTGNGDGNNPGVSYLLSPISVPSHRSAKVLARTEEAVTQTVTPFSASADLSQRAGAFCQYYEDTHARLFGVAYMGTQKDYQVALQLCAKFTDLELQEAAVVWFAMQDDFARTGTRTVPKFATRATECVAKVKALDARGTA